MLSTNGNTVPAKVVPAEGGMLLFVTPQVPLQTGTTYAATLSGLMDASGHELPTTQVMFTTAGLTATGSTPGSSRASHSEGTASEALPPLQAAPGVTALAGQVLTIDGIPLSHALIEINSNKTFSDQTGRFLLKGILPGHRVMIVDGGAANSKTAVWGLHRIGVDVLPRRTNALKYTIWMTPLDTKHVVHVSSPTSSDVVITNPSIPGLELRIPAHTVITNAWGRIVTQIGITPIPD